MKELKVDADFIPCLPVVGDEMMGSFPFGWNVSRASEWIEENLDQV